MLSFNLSQSDRVPIHTRIASGSLPAHTLAQLDSAALANETTQAEIAAAAAESLAQTILVRSLAAPRAKLTHKGMVELDTDDLTPSAAATKVREDHEYEAEAHREAERLTRVRPTRKASMSIPPDSPVTPQQPNGQSVWGAPPPVPAHAFGAPPSQPPLFPSASDLLASMNTDMTLGDVINFDHNASEIDDDENLTNLISTSAPELSSMLGIMSDAGMNFTDPTTLEPSSMSPLIPSGSPSSALSNFDLSSLWGGGNESGNKMQNSSEMASTTNGGQGPDEGATDMDLDGADDDAFDMFLQDEEGPPTIEQPAEPERAAIPLPPPVVPTLDSKPSVWAGSVSCDVCTMLPLSDSAHRSACISIPICRKIHQSLLAKSLDVPSMLLQVFGERSSPDPSFVSTGGCKPRNLRSSSYKCG
jgi:hypothetical protein